MKENQRAASKTIAKNTLLLSLSLNFLAPMTSFASLDSTPEDFNNGLAPLFSRGNQESNSFARLRDASDSVERSSGIRELLQDKATHALTIRQRIANESLETTKFQHFYKGLEVIGSEAFHHRGRLGTQIRNATKIFDLSTTPTLSAENAAALAKAVSGDRGLSDRPELKILPSEQGDSAQLIYWVKVDQVGTDPARKILIDAHSGQIIGNLSEHLTIAPIQIYSAKNLGFSINPKTDSAGKLLSCDVVNLATNQKSTVPGAACNRLGAGACQVVVDGDPVVVNPQNCQLAVNLPGSAASPLPRISAAPDASAVRASNNSQAVLNYYLTHQGRNSFDNAGSTVVSVVHGGVAYDNAHWDVRANQMVYGDGDGKVLGDFSVALDVAGHEMTHGVTEHTAKLLSMGESGALNEAYSDFFGVMISGVRDWAIGKQIFINQASAQGVRNLANPHVLNFSGPNGNRLPYPATYAEKVPMQPTCDQNNDNCWVHINATIPGHASYLITQAIGQAKAEKLYYTVLTHALGARDDIRSAAETTKRTCAQLFDSATCTQVTQAFAQAGL